MGWAALFLRFTFCPTHPRSVLGSGLFRLFVCSFVPFRRPPHSVLGHGLGNRASILRHGTVGFSCSFLLSSCRRPPQLRAGGRPGKSGYSHCGTGRCVFVLFSFSMNVILFSLCHAFSARHLPPLAGLWVVLPFHFVLVFTFLSRPPPPRW